MSRRKDRQPVDYLSRLAVVMVVTGLLLLAACAPLGQKGPPPTGPLVSVPRQDTPSIEEGMKQVNGIELYYMMMGTGEPVVILHGGPGLDHTYLLPQMATLADEYRLVFYDQRASGRSSGRAEAGSITIDNFVNDLEGLRQALDLGKIHLIGHSWGGLLALYYALAYPQNLHSLILVDSAGASWQFRPAFAANLQRRLTEDDRLLLNTLEASAGFRQGQPETMNRFFQVLFKPYFYDRSLSDQLTIQFDEQTARNNLLVNPLMWNHLGNYDIHGRLSGLEVSTLIIHGRDDPLPPEYAEKIHQHLPGSELVLLDRCGHFPYIERPEAFFNSVRGFLARY